jgi:hypothetical protein
LKIPSFWLCEFLLFKKVMNPVVLSMAFSFGVVAIDVVKMAFEMGEPAL